MKYLRWILLVLLAALVCDTFCAEGIAGWRKARRRDYTETLSEGINRRTGHREVEFRVHAGKRNQGLKAEGMDRFGIGELPSFRSGRAPRPSVIQPDLQDRTGGDEGGRRGGRRGGRSRQTSYSDSCDDSGDWSVVE